MTRLLGLLLLTALLSGCGGAPAAASPLPAAEVAGPSVYTDWSRLETRGAPLPAVGSRWYPEYTGALLPSGDYGALVPYAGLRLSDDWPSQTGCLYGLMTTDGRVVTDPVYSSVSRPSWYDGSSWHTLAMLVLSRAETAPAQSPGGTKAVLAVAAADGSWVSDFTYYYASGGPEGLFLIAADGVSLLDGDGKPLYSWTAAQMGFSQEEYARYLSESAAFDSPVGRMWQDYACIGWADGTVRLLQLKTGEVETWPSDDWWRYQERGASSLDWEVVDQGETTLLRRGEETYTIAQSVGNGYAEVLSGLVCFTAQGSVYGLDGRQVLSLGPDWSVYFLQDSLTRSQTPPLLAARSRVGSGARRAYYRLDGTFLMQADNTESWYRQETLVGGLLEVLDLNTASYYNPETMECVFRTYLNFQGD